MAMPGIQTLRLRQPESHKDKENKPRSYERPQELLPSKTRKTHGGVWLPSLSLAFRLIVLVRFSAAMYSNIQDCDEVYNFWEPLHYLDHNYGFQTWETSPDYAIRSWAYIVLHLPFSRAATFLGADSKRRSFFAVRTALTFVSSFCEAKFFRSVGKNMNDHIARYLLFMMIFSPGFWCASPAFLPSTFSMYFTMLALSSATKPASKPDALRTYATVSYFAVGAIVGWPFALLLAVPFVLEELFVAGGDRVSWGAYIAFLRYRWLRLLSAGLVAGLIFIPVIGIDSQAYGKLAVVSWNIIRYNVFGGADRGPALYGTEPWYFYFLNLLLNFNILVPLALASLPALSVTYLFDYRRLGNVKHQPDETSPYTLVAFRLAPLYLWIGVLTFQPHKEERFMYPAYPLVCFNAATTLYLVRGWIEVIYVKLVSFYAATQTKLFKWFTLAVLTVFAILSGSRILALYHYYHAPFDVVYHLEHKEIPRLLNVTGLLPPPPPQSRSYNPDYADQEHVDISGVRQIGLRLCYGKEWYRFPSHYLIPHGVDVQFVKSDFAGLLPRHFNAGRVDGDGLWKREQTRIAPPGLNDMNREETDIYVDITSCDYLIDVDFPVHYISASSSSSNEPRYGTGSGLWDRLFCAPFLDAAHSSQLTRVLYVGGHRWQSHNSFGDYCLLRSHKRIADIEGKKWTRLENSQK